MKVAVAVLGASLLFFAGVLTGAGRRGAVPPPAAIPLGVTAPGKSRRPATPGGSPTKPAAPTPAPARASTTTTVPMASDGPAATAPPGAGGATAPTTPASPTAPTRPAPGQATTPANTTSTTAAPGGVEQVDNQVDCSSTGKRGKGHRSPCPPTTSTTPTSTTPTSTTPASTTPTSGGATTDGARGPAGR